MLSLRLLGCAVTMSCSGQVRGVDSCVALQTLEDALKAQLGSASDSGGSVSRGTLELAMQRVHLGRMDAARICSDIEQVAGLFCDPLVISGRCVATDERIQV